MNKLFLLCLLSIMILYTQCDNCEGTEGDEHHCVDLEASEGKICTIKDGGSCGEETTPTCKGATQGDPHDSLIKVKSCGALNVDGESINKKCAKKTNSDDCDEVDIECSEAAQVETANKFLVSNCLSLKADDDKICTANVNKVCAIVPLPKCKAATQGDSTNTKTKVESCVGLEVQTENTKCVKPEGSNDCEEENIKCKDATLGDSNNSRTKVESCLGLEVGTDNTKCVKPDNSNDCDEVEVECLEATEGNPSANIYHVNTCSELTASDNKYNCARKDDGSCQEVPKCTSASEGEMTGKVKVDSCLKLEADDSNKICSKKSDSIECEETEKPACNQATLGTTSGKTQVGSCEGLPAGASLLCVKSSDSNDCKESIICKNAVVSNEEGPNNVKSCSGLPVSTPNTVCQQSNSVCKEIIKCNFASVVQTPNDSKEVSKCDGLPVVGSNKICKQQSNSNYCHEESKPSETTQNSGFILNAFKITFSLIIIFTIL